MTTVIDIGCAEHHKGVPSLHRLADEHQPDVLYGFDPHPSVPHHETHAYNGATIQRERKAAWTFDGQIGYAESGSASCATDEVGYPMVPCFDLAAFVIGLEGPVVLKLDCEGNEYRLLRHLLDTGADANLDVVWVEWHGDQKRRLLMEWRIGAKVREWRW